jgi:hypothetical protein
VTSPGIKRPKREADQYLYLVHRSDLNKTSSSLTDLSSYNTSGTHIICVSVGPISEARMTTVCWHYKE